jgi:hypothetical protein
MDSSELRISLLLVTKCLVWWVVLCVYIFCLMLSLRSILRDLVTKITKIPIMQFSLASWFFVSLRTTRVAQYCVLQHSLRRETKFHAHLNGTISKYEI